MNGGSGAMTEFGVTSWEQWESWLGGEKEYTTLPVLARLPLPEESLLPESWERMWLEAGPCSIVLESGKSGRYTYMGRRPAELLQGKGGYAEQLRLRLGEGGRADYELVERFEAAPLEAVRRWMRGSDGPRLPAGEGPAWTGGIGGFWSYDIIRSIERLPELAEDDLGLPDYLFMRLDELWIVDRKKRLLFASVHVPLTGQAGAGARRAAYDAAVVRTEEMLREWADWSASSGAAAGLADSRRQLLERERDGSAPPFADVPEGAASPFLKDRYMNAVSRIQDYIAAGDVFQVNLSLRQQCRTETSPEELYEWLRLINPSPYMGLLRTPGFQLVSASPELLVEMKDGRLATRPIAGTRRRGRTPEEDAAMERELRTSEKETAEHIMLVDLERNDLGRVSSYGSVRVEELMAVERYSHVMHLASQVEGRLAEGLDAFDVIAGVFPGGTITGAPKIRTMEIIEELEPVRRGPYTGSMGWIDYSGDMEFNIIIRTMAVLDGQVHIQAGAGIVIDSDPEREYKESISKARALWRAFQYAELHRAADAAPASDTN